MTNHKGTSIGEPAYRGYGVPSLRSLLVDQERIWPSAGSRDYCVLMICNLLISVLYVYHLLVYIVCRSTYLFLHFFLTFLFVRIDPLCFQTEVIRGHQSRAFLVVLVYFMSYYFYSAPQCSHCKRCTSYGSSVRLSVCHTLVLCLNDGM